MNLLQYSNLQINEIRFNFSTEKCVFRIRFDPDNSHLKLRMHWQNNFTARIITYRFYSFNILFYYSSFVWNSLLSKVFEAQAKRTHLSLDIFYIFRKLQLRKINLIEAIKHGKSVEQLRQKYSILEYLYLSITMKLNISIIGYRKHHMMCS